MTYNLNQLAPSAYDLLLNGAVTGGVVRNGSQQPYTWIEELLEALHEARDRLPSKRSNMTFQSWKNSATGLVKKDSQCANCRLLCRYLELLFPS